MVTGDLIKKLRAPMTQQELADRVSALAKEDGLPTITQQYIAKLETHGIKKSSYLPYLARALNISVKDLLRGRTDEPKKYSGLADEENLIGLIREQLRKEGSTGDLSRKLQRMLKKKKAQT